MCETLCKGKDDVYPLILNYELNHMTEERKEFSKLYLELVGKEDEKHPDGYRDWVSTYKYLNDNFSFHKSILDRVFSNCCGDVLEDTLTRVLEDDIKRGAYRRLNDEDYKEHKKGISEVINFYRRLIENYSNQTNTIEDLLLTAYPQKEELNEYIGQMTGIPAEFIEEDFEKAKKDPVKLNYYITRKVTKNVADRLLKRVYSE